MSASAIDLCRALLRCPSVTPQDGGALGVLEAFLKAAGFATHRVVFSEPGTPDIDNLYARIGVTAPVLAFAGHTDVVPVGDPARWRFDPFGGEIAEGAIFGRGAADMKGAIAAFAAAAADFVGGHGSGYAEGKGSIAFLITGDEEGPALNGTQKLLAWAHERGERFDHCIVGEPSSRARLGDTIKIGRRGSLNGTLEAHGRQGHVAYPERAANPIPLLLRLLAALTAAPLDQGTAHFSASNLEVVSVDTGNPAFNVIPAQSRARFNIRFNDLWSAESLAAELRRRAAAAGGRTDGVGYDLTFEPCNAPSFITEPDAFTTLVAQAIRDKTGLTPELSTTGGTSDARFICAFCPVLEFGLPGATMHMVDEHVAVNDVKALAEIYKAVLERYFQPAD
ncbi:succinyl-diaminopimelate desuccinylase [Methylocapsa palsarum]|uniref:Succinyl-diaminopimelate desuccinylase n=1 Tax=Methylocapsa palsarum TaxID=1612308 RepID=A0A1I4BQX5_9HYPH|nr:succinyl-diaminopimelate desuccinylase [Methylocapsa palsarum]SFK71115.1 succinyl-diaminopimelate desuccinylase [Methylocapsa palsarum]